MIIPLSIWQVKEPSPVPGLTTDGLLPRVTTRSVRKNDTNVMIHICKYSSPTKTTAQFPTACSPAHSTWCPSPPAGGSMAGYLGSSCRGAVTGKAAVFLSSPHSSGKSCVWSLANDPWVRAGVGARKEEGCTGEDVLDSHRVAYVRGLIQHLITVGYEFQKGTSQSRRTQGWPKGSDDDFSFAYLYTRSLLWKGPFVISGWLLPNTTCIWKN